MEYVIYKFHKGQKIIVDYHCEYSSEVVAIIPEVQPNGYIMNLIVYKDWNKYKKCYDYHCEKEISLSFIMKLIKEKINNNEKFSDCKISIPKSYKSICNKYEIDRIEIYK